MNPEKTAKRILIVDDEPHVCDSIMMVLKHYGYEVHAVDNAEAGIKSLENGRFDLVTTDQSMRGMTGHELARRIKERWPGQRILLISAYGGMMDLGNVAVDAVLPKPFDADELRDIVAKLLKA